MRHILGEDNSKTKYFVSITILVLFSSPCIIFKISQRDSICSYSFVVPCHTELGQKKTAEVVAGVTSEASFQWRLWGY